MSRELTGGKEGGGLGGGELREGGDGGAGGECASS